MEHAPTLIFNETARRIRDCLRYVRRFKNALIVIYIENEVIASPLFSSHIRDIGLLHAAGLQVLIVPGARMRINQVLETAQVAWTEKNNIRITTNDAMPHIKMAAFDVSNIVMTALAADHITAIIGNWVRARGIGVVDGEDFGTAGEIEHIETDALRTVLSQGFIPIVPCIGWSSTGTPYNISSVQLARHIAEQLQADKLFFVLMDAEISCRQFVIPEEIGTLPGGIVPSFNLNELALFQKANPVTPQTEKILTLFSLAEAACRSGIARVHIINGAEDGTIPCEIFSDFGSGTMIYSSNYGGIRAMRLEDIPAVMTLMRPFVQSGKLLPRTEQELVNTLDDYIVYELDDGIRACTALHQYDTRQAEIAAVAVDTSYAHIGVGQKLIHYLIDRARKASLESVFILTTQSADWFEKLGFIPAAIDTLPPKRKARWSPNRGSRLYRLYLAT
ncbi:MAG: amino-acid N-acetyltransferase [Treponema sp.]|nr:amino-acid N-acetyltransferase [Treponema sp.]